MTARSGFGFILICILGTLPILSISAGPPGDFPHFQVPGYDSEMSTLRDLYWLHYPGAGPKATLWDEWLSGPALWPATAADSLSDKMRQQWSAALSGRMLDAEGYVATQQHASIAHQQGWPFPFWNQGRRGCGWHFSFKNTAPQGWRPNELSKKDGWMLESAKDGNIGEEGWRIELTNPGALLTAPPWNCDTFEAPFLQLRWESSALSSAQPFIEWTTTANTNFDGSRRMYFAPPQESGITYTMIPMYRHPQWTGEVAQLRIGLGNSGTGTIILQAFFSQYDTRHNINNQAFIRGCAKYFWWTLDLNFLRANINRMRLAERYLMTEHKALDKKVIVTDWVGHDGRSGLVRAADGKQIISGRGIGNNYWDLLPFGGKDAYATVQYYHSTLLLAEIELEIRQHPDWQIPRGPLAFEPEFLKEHATAVSAEGNELFWSAKTGRFVACIDSDGVPHDYGFTFLNCEAVAYGFANAAHSRSILDWLQGNRMVEGDTSQGGDIYHWRFAPRATTRRNIDWYFWAWNNPEGIPWGGQVQDGGAVLAFSSHDLFARLKVLGPDNTWERLKRIIAWFGEVQAVGGYRKYYDGKREGALQGNGTPGGLGLDFEFFESVMVPQIMLSGFLGFAPSADGFFLDPKLPKDWPELAIDRIRFHNSILKIRALGDGEIELSRESTNAEPFSIGLPAGKWVLIKSNSNAAEPASSLVQANGETKMIWETGASLRLKRAK